MKITLSKYAGFCEGVQRAYEIVEKAARDPKVKKPIFVLGSLVHNDEVVAKIEKMGIKKLEIEGSLENFFEKAKNEIGTLVITAHGMGPEIYELVKKYGIELVDTTCPRVIKVQRLAKIFSDRGFQIVIIGERNHKEVIGIFQWGKSAAVFVETEAELSKLDLDPNREIAVLSQTTQDQKFIKRAAAHILEKYPKAEIVDSICQATHNRQDEVVILAANNDAIIVIGSLESANSRRLWEVARSVNESSFFVALASQLDLRMFKDKKTIAVTAGASTPSWVIEDVLEKLKSLK